MMIILLLVEVIATFGDTAAFESQFSSGYKMAAASFSFPGDRPAYVYWDPEFGSSKPITSTTTSTTASSSSSIDNSSAVLGPLVMLIAIIMIALL